MRKKLKAQDMKHRIIFQTHSLFSDGSGVKSDWTDGLEVWAKISPRRSLSDRSEMFRHGVIGSDVGYRITVRYDENIMSEMRIKYGTQILKIERLVNIDEGSEWLEIEAVV